VPYPTSVRLPEDVRRVLRKVAKQNRRTVTEQINFVLQEWIKRDLQPRSQDVQVGGDFSQDDRATSR
jgi:hypothetical protein